MTPAQCRAARGLLDWTQATLAGVSGLAVSTVVKFERSETVVAAANVQTMQLANNQLIHWLACRPIAYLGYARKLAMSH
jgi:transcriptional regulator with XRE-family HTH domain